MRTYTTLSASKKLGVSVGTVYNLIHSGRLKATKVGKSYHIHPYALMEYVTDPAARKPHKRKSLRSPAPMPTPVIQEPPLPWWKQIFKLVARRSA